MFFEKGNLRDCEKSLLFCKVRMRSNLCLNRVLTGDHGELDGKAENDFSFRESHFFKEGRMSLAV